MKGILTLGLLLILIVNKIIAQSPTLVDYTIHFEAVEGFENDCTADDGTEEYSWILSTPNSSECVTCDKDGDCFKLGTWAVTEGTTTKYGSVPFQMESWEDDIGSRCEYDVFDLTDPTINVDDCHFIRSSRFYLSQVGTSELNELKNYWTSQIIGFNIRAYAHIIYSYPSTDLNSAVNASGQTNNMVGGGTRPFWGGKYAPNYYKGTSGTIGHNANSTMTTTISCTNHFSFNWSVSSEENDDYLAFYIDGELQDRISGNKEYQNKQYDVSIDETHILTWEYSKSNNNIANGYDQGSVWDLNITSVDPNTFGDNEWLVQAYDGQSLDLSGSAYKGYYAATGVDINTGNYWPSTESPSSAPSYTGCDVPNDYHTYVHKRRGFPCGNYSINIDGHDDGLRVYIDGTQVFEHIGWGDAHAEIWTGVLDENSTVEIRTEEGHGRSYTQIDFIRLTPWVDENPPIIGDDALCSQSLPLKIQAQNHQVLDDIAWFKDGESIQGFLDDTHFTLVNDVGTYHFETSNDFCATRSQDHVIEDHRSSTNVNSSIYENDSIFFFDRYLTTEGNYSTPILTNAQGCDSVHSIDLKVLDLPDNYSCGHALNFDGIDDYVDVQGIEGDFFGLDITIEIWFKTTTSGENSLVSVNSSSGGNQLLLRLSNGLIKVFDGSSNSFEIISPETYNNGYWHHLVYARGGNIGRLYVDGDFIDEHQADYFFNGAVQWSLGQEFDNETLSDFYQGSMDDFRVWLGEYAPDELPDEITGNESGLITAYNFDGPVGVNALNDLTSNNNDGIMMNMQSENQWVYTDGGIIYNDSSTYQAELKRGESIIIGNSTINTLGEHSIVTTNARGCGDSTIIATITTTPLNSTCGNVLHFDGSNDHVRMNSVATDMAEQSNATMEAWIKTTAIGTNSILSVNTSSGGNVVLLRIDDGQAKIYDGANSSFEIESIDLYNNNLWHHFAYSKEGSTGYLFVDGQEIGSHTVNYSFSNNDLWSIGQEFDGSTISDLFEGSIDEVVIWNKSLTQAEIQARILDSSPVNDINVVAHYDFNKGAGSTTLHDNTTNHSGTLTSMDPVNDWLTLTGESISDSYFSFNHKACDEYNFNNTLLSSNGIYESVLTTVDGCDSVITVDLTIETKDTATAFVGGNNEWNVYTYSGGNVDLTSLEYYGMYVDTNFNVNTTDYYDILSNPSSISHYTGCSVGDYDFTTVYKRTGFPCGSYEIDIINHDDAIAIIINGSEVYEHSGWGDSHPGIWTGLLDAKSTVEIRTAEYVGDSYTIVDFKNTNALSANQIYSNETGTIEIADILHQNVYLEGHGIKRLVSDIVVTEDLTISNGAQLDLNGHSIEVLGNIFNYGNGFSHNPNETVILSGINTVSIGGCTDVLPIELHRLEINKLSGQVILNTDLNIYDEINLKLATSSLIIPSEKILTLKSTSIATARLAQVPTGATINGRITIEQFMNSSSQKWWYLSSPVKDLTVADWQQNFPITGDFSGAHDLGGTNNASLYKYDETNPSNSIDAGWISYPQSSNAEEIKKGIGYSVFIRDQVGSSAPRILETTGIPNIGLDSIPITYTESQNETVDGWNLIGNPYPSEIDWSSPTGWVKQNIDNAIYIKDVMAGINTSWVDGVGSGRSSGIIGAQQGFWVKANAPNPSLQINESAKSQTYSGLLKTTQVQDVLRISLTKNGLPVETVVRAKAGASNDFDPQFDAYFWENDLDYSICSHEAQGDKLSINAIPTNGTQDVPLYIRYPEDVHISLEIRISGKSNFTAYSVINLVDNYLKTSTPLTEDFSYPFTTNGDPNSMDEFRFSLAFSSIVTSESNTPFQDDIYVYPSPGKGKRIFISEGLTSSTVRVINARGQIMFDNHYFEGREVKFKNGLDPGMYLIHINDNDLVVTKKFIVR